VATPGHTKAARIYFDGYRVSQTVSAANIDFATDAAEATAIEDTAKVFLQGKTGMTSALNGFLDIADDGEWDTYEIATLNDGAHEITVCPVGNTGGSIAYVARHFSTGDSRAFDQANVVMLNWNGQNEGDADFGRGTVITTGEKAFTAAASDGGDEVGAAGATDTTIIAVHCTAFTGLTDIDIQIEESSDDASADAYEQVTGWSIDVNGNATAGSDEVVFDGTGSAFFTKTGAIEAWVRVTCSDATGVGSATFLASHALAVAQ